ncbi:MAG: ABC transporter permease [Microthrixaceae bacterium]
MLRVAFKDLMARKRRLVTTGLAVILGIAFLTGTQILGGVLNDSIDSLISDVYSGYDAVVRSPDVQDAPFGEFRPPVDASVAAGAAEVPEARAAFGIVESPTAQLVGPDGKALATGFGPPTLVFNWFDDPIRPGIVVDGRGPDSADEMAMEFKTAADNDWEIGDTVTVLSQQDTRDFELVGLLGLGEEGDQFSGAKPLYFIEPVAQELADLEGRFSYVAAGAADGVSQEELAEALAAELDGLQVVTGEEFTQENVDATAQFVGILTIAVSVFGYIALIVAAFIIYNTFSIIVAQRTRETGLLRAIGASRRQVIVANIAEAVLIGVFASVLGLAFGSLLATGIKAATGQILTVESGIAWPNVGTVVLAFIVGVGVTSVSAVIPAVRASRISPIAALGELGNDRSAVSRSRQIWGFGMLLAGIALAAIGLTGAVDSYQLQLVGLGLFLILVSVAVVLGPLLARPAASALSWPFTRRGSVTAQIGAENAARNPRRTAATAAALTVGVTLVVVIAVLANSIKASVTEEIEEGLGGVDLIVSAGNFSFLGVPPAVTEQAAALDGVEDVSPWKFAQVVLLDDKALEDLDDQDEPEPTTDDQQSIFGSEDTAPDGEAAFATGFAPNYWDIIDMGDIEGDPTASSDMAIVARAKEAEDRGWEVGDQIPVYFAATGEQDLTLVATFSDGLGPDDNFYVPNEVVAANSTPGFDNDFLVTVRTGDGDGVRDGVQEELEALVSDRPDVVVQNLGEYIETQTSFIDTFVTVIYGLLALAVIIALIGIGNTLSLSVLERTREFGLLRAVGMSRRQLRWTLRSESAIVAVFGTLLGMAIGILFAVALAFTISADDPGLLTLRLPIAQLIIITVLAALAGVIAAILPARRAVRLDLLKAIASD